MVTIRELPGLKTTTLLVSMLTEQHNKQMDAITDHQKLSVSENSTAVVMIFAGQGKH